MADTDTAAGDNPTIDDPKTRASAAAQMNALEGRPAETAPDPDDADLEEERTVAQSFDASATPFSPPPRENKQPAMADLATKNETIGEKPTPSAKSQPATAPAVAPSSPRSSPAAPSSRQEDPPNRQASAPAGPGAIIASAIASHIQRPQTQSQPAAPVSPPASPSPAQSLLDRFAVKRILDTLRPKAQAGATAPTATSAANPTNPQAPPQPGANQTTRAPNPPVPGAAPTTLRNVPQSEAGAPAGGLRDKLGSYTAKRVQPRRDAEQVRGVSQAAANVLASLQAVEQQETTGILTKIRDAAKANGSIENVLSEMRPGGQFEDLRKEFNVVLSRDEGFAAAYHKAAGAMASYAETRTGMTAASQTRADPNLARLETLDQEIAEAAKKLPGVSDGKSAFEELVENGREAVQKLFSSVQQMFNREANVRGPSPSPGLGS